MFNLFKRKKKMKYKVGDKVRVRFDLREGEKYGHFQVFDYMYKFKGMILTIRGICERDESFICEENDIWWHSDMVEPYNETFTKSDLKTGMTVVLRNGQKKLVLRDTPLEDIFVGGSWANFDYYTDDLKFIDGSRCFDIIEVYKPLYNYLLMPEFLNKNKIEDGEKYKLVWKREEKPVELTMDEIAKKFNVDVKNLKIKK